MRKHIYPFPTMPDGCEKTLTVYQLKLECGKRASKAIIGNGSKPRIKSVKVDLSHFGAAPSARLSHLPFEGDGAFPAQC